MAGWLAQREADVLPIESKMSWHCPPPDGNSDSCPNEGFTNLFALIYADRGTTGEGQGAEGLLGWPRERCLSSPDYGRWWVI